ncbi:tol-pal system protein YbgF [Rhizobium sp. RU20A]|uniref:tol-pal system protein YbgF n=1 Tax=Rhizobium sp. RU20A TaxID=1907412 RepID=UPI000954F0C7|nr:tol-pal system protein YbgF [Rhizobium sp. RU20A]SIQ37768.1 tol-pal system protein YbgF [Rhizobium sp. RU20A]
MKQFVVATMIALSACCATAGPSSAGPLTAFMTPPVASQSNLPVVRVQAEAGRITQLEEQIRQLNGRIEEMSFQLLQMQEQIRKFQEDNEFRFQDLEKGAGGNRKQGAVTPPPSAEQQASVTPGVTDGSATAVDPSTAGADQQALNSATGAPAETLGQIVFDENGNPVAANRQQQPLEQQSSLPGVSTTTPPATQGATQGQTQQSASLDNPSDLYQVAYGHVLAGDYAQAEQEFRDYLDIFPKGEKAADANFWMGEAQYSQGKFSESAKTFLNAHQAFSSSPKAPEMLLKLGMSLAQLDNKETACATLREVGKRYPNASSAVKGKVKSEQNRLAC